MSALIALLLACAARFPAGTEHCNGADDDRDGRVDQPFDQDGDGFLSCIIEDRPADCNDRDPGVHPLAAESCDGQDSDCDGELPPWEADDDGDGWATCEGDCDDGDRALSPIDGDADGWSACAGDCDDADPGRRPGADEACDGLDTDCDGLPDAAEEDLDADGQRPCAGDCDDARADRTSLDRDGDGATSCDEPPDCDDWDPWRAPGAPEICDGLDNDCDGAADDDCL